MADFNESLQNAAAKPSRDAPLSAIETRLRRRHRLRQGAVGVSAIALVGALGGGIALSTDDGPSIKTGLPPAATQAYGATDPPISFELPDGWVESPLGLPYPHEVFSVGTAVQPSGVVHEVCRADPEYQDDVFVMLREFTAYDLMQLALDPQPGVSGIARLDYKQRPADFATEPREGGSCYADSASDPTAGTPVFTYVFQDADRKFIADVSFGTSSSAERQAEAFAVLNSLVVTPYTAIPEPTVPTVPPSTVPPSADTEAITAAFLGWIDTRPIDASGVYIEDFASIRDAVIGAAAANGHPDDYRGRVEAITRIGENEADVIYSFIIDGQPVVANLPGRAVRIDGVWLVSRDTVCEALLQGPVHCPPRS